MLRGRISGSDPRAPGPATGSVGLLARPLLVGFVGLAVGLAVYGLSRVDGELLSAGFFVLGLYAIPLTAGLVLAAVIEAGHRGPVLAHRSRAGPRDRCGLCGRTMTKVGWMWVCAACDGVVIRR
jgi:hypothetical protein